MDDIIKDVPVVMQLAKEIEIEEYPLPPPRSFRPGRWMAMKFIVPAIISATLFLLAFIFGLFNPYTGTEEEMAERSSAIIQFAFWALFFIVAWLAMVWVRARMWASVQEAHKVTKITGEQHRKLIGIMFGPASIVMIAIIAAVIMIYDFNAFGLEIYNIYQPSEVEGWLLDSGFGDELYVVYYVNDAMAIVFLVTWWLGDIVSAAFCWYAIAFLIYSHAITHKFTYRNEPSVVKQLRLTDDEQKAFMSVAYGYIIFITVKSVAQIFPQFLPWWSDTILTIVTVLFFVLLLLMPVKHIERDLKSETKDDEIRAKARSILSLVDVITKVEKGEELSLKNAVMALLYASYLDQLKDLKKIVGKNNTKILGSLAGPLASTGAKTFAGGTGMPF